MTRLNRLRCGCSARRSAWRPIVTVGLAMTLAACSNPVTVARENDRLRRSNMELQRQVTELEKERQLRSAQIDALQQRLEVAPAIADAELPQLVAVRFGRLSGAIDEDRNNVRDTLRIYLQTIDQHGRFLPVAGRAQLQAVAITPGSDPKTVVEHTFEPVELDKMYRSGLTGTHYTLKLPLPDPLPPDLTEVTAKVTFTDAATGVQLSCQHAYPLRPAAPTSE